MRIFVTGGTGLVGRRLIPRLAGRGDGVVVLSRSDKAADGLPAGVEIVRGDLARPGPWLDLLAGCDAVIHLAGEPIAGRRWSDAVKKTLYDSRIDSTRLIAERLAQSPTGADGVPRVWVCASAVGYYGFSTGRDEFAEESPPGDDFLARICVAWEAACRPAADAGVRVANVRVGVVLDPAGGALAKMVTPFKLYVGGPLGSGEQWLSWIHADDLVGILLLALDDAAARGPINGTAPEPQTNWGFAQALGRVLRRPSWLRTPAWVLRVVVGGAAQIVVTGQRVVPKRALELGYAFRFPDLEPALRDLLDRPAEGKP